MENEIYIVIEVMTGRAAGDSGFSQGMYVKKSYKEAKALWHSKMSSAMKNPDVESELCMIVNGSGGVYDDANEKYVNEDYSQAIPE